MKRLLSIFLMLCPMVGLSQSKLSALTQITYATNTDLMYVISNTGTRTSFSINTSNLLDSLISFKNWPSGQPASGVLSNIASNPYTGYTNLAMQVAANNVLSNLQTMASLYFTNGQASAMVLSNIVGLGVTGFTNTVNGAISNLTTTNITAVTGASTSNSFVGGVVYYSLASFTNLNNTPGTLTNLANVSLSGHSITNNGDTIYARWGGRLANAAANTNNFQIVYGGTTVLDTGLQVSSNCAFIAECRIIRSGTSAQHVEAALQWGPSGGVPWAFTNVNLETTVNAGIAQTLALKGGATRVGAHTNNSFTVEFKPGPR
jgi:hypothetical protein